MWCPEFVDVPFRDHACCLPCEASCSSALGNSWHFSSPTLRFTQFLGHHINTGIRENDTDIHSRQLLTKTTFNCRQHDIIEIAIKGFFFLLIFSFIPSALFTFIELVVRPLSSTLNGMRWQKVLEAGIYFWLMNSQSEDGGQIASAESIWGKDRRWEQVFLPQA